ncbi:suppressor APC domain-containing protein 1 isoform X3 [Ambystoma mexicanum]|uniref:suppressor APC domain-containing protein 1 isoform X3 n=1 Tax=Ambystoma mexicanum TaxID=8296 RepID=UPI0037E7E480
MAVRPAYAILILPLQSGLHSWEALHFFLWLRQLKELEQERDSLLHGLEMVEKARDWYHQRLLESQDRQKNLGMAGSRKDFLADPYSNYGCLLLARIQEVNLSLNNLFSGPGKTDDPAERPPGQGFSSPALPGLHFYPQALGALQEQNQLLIQEVTEKSDRIAQLEKEKAALRKQLQESRPYRPSSHKESTFI